MDCSTIFWENFEKILSEMQLTSPMVERMADLPQGVLSKGRRKGTPELSRAMEIADALGVTLDQLCFGRDEIVDIKVRMAEIDVERKVLQSKLSNINRQRVKNAKRIEKERKKNEHLRKTNDDTKRTESTEESKE